VHRPRAEALVDLAAVQHNVGVLRSVAPGAALMAVVKADGYGHGAVPVARAALAAGASWLGVCTVDEALGLRAAGLTAPILSWLNLPDDDFAAAIAADVDLSVASVVHLTAVLAGARQAGRLVTFGVVAVSAETGYGYIRPNRKVTLEKQGMLKGHPVSRFVEKPNAAKAAQYSTDP